ncbi:MAG: glycosyltransferase family 2 protein [Planctomycetota bacterium]|jgi:GT2 family glycosyltransferase
MTDAAPTPVSRPATDPAGGAGPTPPAPPARPLPLGVLAIGRNEGDRLRACLASVGDVAAGVVYVDSGSTDGSPELAGDFGADVIRLDTDRGFTAARARNAGIRHLLERRPDLTWIQTVDGDCELCDGWLARGVASLEAEPGLAGVVGHLHERAPEASVYQRLCDLEWRGRPGSIDACGGNALWRAAALAEVGGYDESMIAGEEPEMCHRLRSAGWRLERIDHDMALHDAAMTRFGQWWRRNVRGGWAIAEGAGRHYRLRQSASIWAWGLLLPAAVLAAAWPTGGWSLLGLLAYPLLLARIASGRRRDGDPAGHAWLYAGFCVMGKIPQLVGQVRYRLRRRRGGTPQLIDYKAPGRDKPAAIRSDRRGDERSGPDRDPAAVSRRPAP